MTDDETRDILESISSLQGRIRKKRNLAASREQRKRIEDTKFKLNMMRIEQGKPLFLFN
ncbi:hypothetical protein J4N42_06150 [Vibrio sp. SCSIO 43135]|uniref:hypothetical protein n=1 Tax=Vibrio sp. SCSIO 43135 TaxID=2819096 RepID=UPI0020756CA3|nr:hypothetical protein [Vibrio sp. SCSIO 43135]USD42299.1 hypothetical protein J4N42_06150 [Vibrio sp. SCSIO 43135]